MLLLRHICRPGNAGFTLVELSIVLIIIAIIVGMTVVSGVATLNSARLTSTQQKMAVIDQALMAYRLAHDQLPCPSDLTAVQGNAWYGKANTSRTSGYQYCAQTPASTPYGVRIANNFAGTAVAVAEGGVPAVDLGLPFDFMYDGWGNRFRYAVDVYMAYTGLSGGSTGTPNNSNTFSGTQIGSTCGAITIYGDSMPNSVSNPSYGIGHTAYVRSNAAIYALISHGPNSSGAFSAGGLPNAGNDILFYNLDEMANCNCSVASGQNASYSPTYVQEQPYVYNPSNSTYNFDDIVTYKERWQIQAPNDTWGNSCPRVYVTDSSNNRVEIFDLNGNYISQFPSPNTGPSTANGQLNNPNAIFIDNASNAWVVDDNNNRIEEFALSSSSTGASTAVYVAGIGAGYNGVTGSVGSSGSGSGQFHLPSGIAIDKNGEIWVTDSNNARIQVFNSSLAFVMGVGAGYNGVTGSIGSSGYANGQLNNPDAIGFDQGNNAWVIDTNNNRVEEFSNSGTWLQSIGWSSTSGFGCETSPSASPACSSGSANNSEFGNNAEGIFADRFGNIWVGDGPNNRVAEFTNNGAYITSFSTNTLPMCLMLDPSGNVWVANITSNNIQKCTNGTCTTYGGTGTGNGKFTHPYGIAIPNWHDQLQQIGFTRVLISF